MHPSIKTYYEGPEALEATAMQCNVHFQKYLVFFHLDKKDKELSCMFSLYIFVNAPLFHKMALGPLLLCYLDCNDESHFSLFCDIWIMSHFYSLRLCSTFALTTSAKRISWSTRSITMASMANRSIRMTSVNLWTLKIKKKCLLKISLDLDSHDLNPDLEFDQDLFEVESKEPKPIAGTER